MNDFRPSASKPSTLRRGFTLIELLVVMAIVAMMLALTINVGTAWRAEKLTGQARQLASEFAQAALLAQKDNYPVEIRFYQLPDELTTGQATTVRAFQLVRLTGYNANTQEPIYKYLTEVKYFEDDIILHPNNMYNTILASMVKAPAADAPLIRGERRPYFSFMFMPDGTTSLARTPDAVFTLVKETENKTANLPPNYRSVVLQPVTGKSTVY